jgi:hypothetical protein
LAATSTEIKLASQLGLIEIKPVETKANRRKKHKQMKGSVFHERRRKQEDQLHSRKLAHEKLASSKPHRLSSRKKQAGQSTIVQKDIHTSSDSNKDREEMERGMLEQDSDEEHFLVSEAVCRHKLDFLILKPTNL